MRLASIFLAALAACDTLPPGLAERSEAAQRVAWGVIGARGERPSVQWRESNCLGPRGESGIFWGFACVAGGYYPNAVELPYPSPAISDTAFAHEHVHAWMWADFGAEDPGHSRPEWAQLPEAISDAIRARPEIDVGD